MYLKPTLQQVQYAYAWRPIKAALPHKNMDFLDPKKKRAHQIRLFIGYGLMSIVLLIGTGILVFIAKGFYYDRNTKSIIQNGIVFVDSQPVKGLIFINGKEETQADTRLDLPANSYDIEIRRTGYRTWKQHIDLVGGTIERLVYAFIWPDKLEAKELTAYASAPGFATQSPDRRWLLIQQTDNFNAFTLTDLRNETNTSTGISLPTTILVPGPGQNQLKLVEWSTDNRHVIVSHTFQGGTNFVLVDIEQPTASVNLTRAFPNTPFTAVRLRDKRFDQLYLHNTADGTLVTADVRTRIVTPQLNRVLAFQPHGEDVVLFVTDENAPVGKVTVRLRQGINTYNVREFPVGSNYLIDIARFENRWYMAAGVNNDPRVYLYKDMFDRLGEAPQKLPEAFSVLRVDNPEFVSFSANTRFVGVQGGSRFAVYDAEMERSYRFDTGLALLPGQKASWMDGHRYTLISNGTLYAFEFDGNNIQGLTAVNPAYLPFFDRDYRVLYTLAPQIADPAKTSLGRIELRVVTDR